MIDGLRRMTAVTRPRVVGLVTVGHGVNEFLSIVFPPIIPLLVSRLDITYGQAGFLLTVFFLMYVLFQLPAGVLADWLGKRRVMVVGLGVMSGAIVFASVAGTYDDLLAAQALAGIGGSTYHPTGMAIISDGEQAGTEGRAMGVFGLGGALGTLLSPVVVGGLAALGDWRLGLASAGAIGLAATLAIVLAGGTADDADPGEADPADADSTPNGGTDHRSVGTRFSAIAAEVPRTRRVGLLLVITALLSLQHRAIQTYTTAYVAEQAGVSSSVGNVGFFALLLGGTVSSVWAGDLADRFRGEYVGAGIAVALAVLVGGLLVVSPVVGRLPALVPLAGLSVLLAVVGGLTYAAYPVKNALVSAEALSDASGSLFGTVQTASAVGSAAGPALFGVLAEEWGVVAAFPAIAGVGLVLAGVFLLTARLD